MTKEQFQSGAQLEGNLRVLEELLTPKESRNEFINNMVNKVSVKAKSDNTATEKTINDIASDLRSDLTDAVKRAHAATEKAFQNI